MACFVYGNTFKHKRKIKELGFRWNARQKFWQKFENPDDKTIEALETLSGVIVILDDKELIDNRSHKEKYGRCEDAPCCGCCGQHSYYGGEY